MNFKAARITVCHGSTPTPLPAGRIQIKNTGTVPVLIGGHDLADDSNGYPLEPGETLTYQTVAATLNDDASPQLIVAGATDGQVTYVTVGAGQGHQ